MYGWTIIVVLWMCFLILNLFALQHGLKKCLTLLTRSCMPASNCMSGSNIKKLFFAGSFSSALQHFIVKWCQVNEVNELQLFPQSRNKQFHNGHLQKKSSITGLYSSLGRHLYMSIDTHVVIFWVNIIQLCPSSGTAKACCQADLQATPSASSVTPSGEKSLVNGRRIHITRWLLHLGWLLESWNVQIWRCWNADGSTVFESCFFGLTDVDLRGYLSYFSKLTFDIHWSIAIHCHSNSTSPIESKIF